MWLAESALSQCDLDDRHGRSAYWIRCHRLNSFRYADLTNIGLI